MTMFVSSDVPPNEANIAREVFFSVFSVKAIFGTFPPLSFPQRLHGMRSERRKFPFSAENLPTSSFFFAVRVSAAYVRREIDNKCLDIVLDSINFSTFFFIATFRREEDNRKNAEFRGRES